MSFFNSEQLNTTGQITLGNDFPIIPKGTQVKAAITDGKWKTIQQTGAEVISLTWEILAPKEYMNQKIFQNLKVKDENESKRNKAMMMLAAIDKNCKGKIAAKNRTPSDEDLLDALLGHPQVLLLDVWKSTDKDGNEAEGNWVKAVSPCAKKEAPKPAPAPVADSAEDDIPW